MGKKGKPRLKEEEPVTKDEAKIEEAKPVEEERKIIVRKWKGKDWFSVSAPPEFDGKFIGLTPATDPKHVISRNIEVGVSDIVGDSSKYYMKLIFRVHNLQGNNALTRFNGFECTRDHLLRMVRKRSQKVEVIVDAKTKDGWVLRFKPWIILRGNTPYNVERKIRHMTQQIINEVASKNTAVDIVKKVISSELQLMLKKEGSKIHPVRFSEIARIKVLSVPETKAKAS